VTVVMVCTDSYEDEDDECDGVCMKKDPCPAAWEELDMHVAPPKLANRHGGCVGA
jgi:hypothetical protein